VTSARLRPSTETDLVERTRHYRTEADDQVGERFFNSAVEALHAIEKMPGIGSLRLGELCDVPGPRSYRLPCLPCGWFHFEHTDHVDVVRLLSHARA
jgi:toxin ParE1/3/4